MTPLDACQGSATVQRLLIVDDDPILLDALSAMMVLRLPHLTVETADDPVHALERIYESCYGAIISDYRMPKLHGLTFLEEVKRIRPCTPVLLSTASGDRRLASDALRRGAADVLWKPIERNDCIRSVKTALRLHHLHHQIERTRRRMTTLQTFLQHAPLRHPELAARLSLSLDRLRSHTDRLEQIVARLDVRSRLLKATVRHRLLRRTYLSSFEDTP